MSHEALPIDAAAFARALEGIPVDALHGKAAELRNSISHLKSSNEQMMPFADEGDQDCKDAMFENLVVIGRMNERIDLLRAEVERRGMRWADAEVEDKSADTAMTDGDGRLVNGDTTTTTNPTASTTAGTSGEAQASGSGSLTDQELMARMQERMGEADEEEGVHL